MMNDISIFPYVYLGTKKNAECNALFSEITDFNIQLPCLDTGVMLEYIFRAFRFNDYLYITDMFPVKWENEKDRSKRILSREGNRINMRKLSATCLVAFYEHYMKHDNDATMVIRGSYQHGEKEEGVSRKLPIYWAIYEPLFETLSLKAVKIFELNAFVMTPKNSRIEDQRIIEDYRTFRKLQYVQSVTEENK